MANEKKLLDSEPDKISVYSFAGSIIIPTEQGAYWASAVGGVVESRPTGNPYVLFALKYIWDVAGQVSEFSEPIRIRLNTAMAVTEKFDFKFPVPEVLAEEPASTPLVDELGAKAEDYEDGDEDGDEDGELAEDDEDGELAEDDEEIEDYLAEASHSDDELSW